MTIINRAALKIRDGQEKKLSLFRVERGVFRWVEDATSEPFDGVDYLSDTDAIKGLRVLVDGDPAYVGCELTIHPVSPPAEERAARRIYEWFDNAGDSAPEIFLDAISEIIRNETAIDKLTETLNLLLAYEVTRLRAPKPAGLDLVHAGLLLDAVCALERSQAIDLTGIKSRLKQPVERIQVYQSTPQGRPQ